VGKFIQKLEQVAGVLQVEVLDLRMIPVRQLFLRFPRIIRDIAKQNGKMVEINFFGEETEIDKQIAERLVDPLTHIIRNAVDHGLEDAERRRFIGKPETGRITLGAAQEGDYIIISVRDDGKGLNLEKIREKGVKMGLIKQGVTLREDELVNLIFLPGFSTTDHISDISGRGVGLDIVYNSIKELKGDVEIDYHTNQGTTFQLKVPLTLAIIQSFLVKVGGQIFGIPSAEVMESLLVDVDSIHKFSDKMVYSLRQEAITVVDLNNLFNFTKTVNSSKTPLIIVKYGRYKLGLMVEALIGQEEIMIKQINKALAENPLLAGAALLGNGEIALILNITEIIKKAFI
jgi:two-component system chemotaxis sensor kinase CheA